MYTYEEQVKLFKSLIPIGRKSTPELINIIKEKVDVIEISPLTLPHRGFALAQYNATHCILNSKLKLNPQDMEFHAFEVIENSKSKVYFNHGNSHEQIYFIIEAKTQYIFSNSNRLFLELELARGVT